MGQTERWSKVEADKAPPTWVPHPGSGCSPGPPPPALAYLAPVLRAGFPLQPVGFPASSHSPTSVSRLLSVPRTHQPACSSCPLCQPCHVTSNDTLHLGSLHLSASLAANSFPFRQVGGGHACFTEQLSELGRGDLPAPCCHFRITDRVSVSCCLVS